MSCLMLKPARKSKYFLLGCLLTLCGQRQLQAQQASGNSYVPLGGDTYHLIDRIDIKYPLSYRYLNTQIKPFLREDVASLAKVWRTSEGLTRREHWQYDYIGQDNREFMSPQSRDYFSGELFHFFYPEPATFYQFFSVRVNPVLHNSFGMSSDSSNLRYTNTRGFELRGSVDDKVGFYLYATENQAVLPDYIQERVDAAPQVMPGDGVTKIFKDNGVDYFTTHGYISFNPTEHIEMQFGQDKMFIGDGIRSMIWSDNAKDQLMLRINTHLWRLHYLNVFTELANYDGSNIYNSLIHKKYAAFHYLTVPIIPQLEVGVFESIIFDRYNANGYETGFELNYLNPVIFYRAVESGLGSADNALVGATLKTKLWNTASVYGQLVLDEFVFGELFGGNKWWGNKYALQAGAKYINAFNIEQLDLQYEFNMARPYTYSYEDDNGSSYTHYAQAIAHPLGANFKEQLFRIWYQPARKLTIRNTTMIAQQGVDSAGINYGSNIFLDYNTYPSAYNNITGQGISQTTLLNDLLVSYAFWHNTFLDLHITYRDVNSEFVANDQNELFFSIGVRMNEGVRGFMW